MTFFCGEIYTDVYNTSMNQVTPAQILQQIAQIQHMEPGKLCVIGHGPNGPYYNLQCREKGKTLSLYVSADQVSVVGRAHGQLPAIPGPGRSICPTHRRADTGRASAGHKKRRPLAAVPPGPRPGNRAVDGPFPGRYAQRSRRPGIGSAFAHRCLQVCQPGGGLGDKPVQVVELDITHG